MVKNFKLFRSILFSSILLLSSPLYADNNNLEVEFLNLFDNNTKHFIVGSGKRTSLIHRKMTGCAKNRGVLQPLVPIEGIKLATETDVLRSINCEDSILVDMRSDEQYFKETIPTSINIPPDDIYSNMEKLGCSEISDGKFDCSKSYLIYGFCNGPACGKAGKVIKEIVHLGFPIDKIRYYRGGMLTWCALGLTTSKGSF